jgi:hypothetical protein
MRRNLLVTGRAALPDDGRDGAVIRRLGCCVAAIALLAFPFGQAGAGEATTLLNAADAQPAAALLDSMGINTHFPFTDSAYATRYADVRAKLVALGLHHVRDAPNGHMADLATAGIMTTMLAEPSSGTPVALRDRVKALNAHGPVVDAVEGANEPDMFWQRLHIAWQGQGYPEGPALWQRELYAAFKSDPATAALTIIGPSLGLAGMPNATPPASWKGLWEYADWGDFHPYPYNGNPFGPPLAYGDLHLFYTDGTFPSVDIDQSPDAYRAYRSIYGSAPMAATETGYPTGPYFTSEVLQAKYIPRVYVEYFRLRIRRTYLYQLLDNIQDPTGRDADASFGLLRYDLSERPSFGAVAALARLLAEPRGPGSAVPAGMRLTLRVTGVGTFSDASRVHNLLLKRPDGTLLLLLWDEVSGEDASVTPRRPIEVPPLPATIEASDPVRFVVDGIQGQAAQSIHIQVTDALLAIEIAR